MTDILLDETMRERIACCYDISNDPENPGHVRVFNKDRGQHMKWAFASADAAMTYIAASLQDEDADARKKAKQIDPRIRILEDFEGDWIIHLEGSSSFGAFSCADDAKPLAADLSDLIIEHGYYTDPADPNIE